MTPDPPADPPHKRPDNRDKRESHQERERTIAALADQQHAVVATWQLVNLGFDRRAIHRRATAGRLHRRHRGVYSVGHRTLTREGHWMAAVLAYGPGAVLSHWTAGALLGFATAAWRIHVTTPRNSRSRRGIVAHVSDLHPEDVTEHNGIPATSVTRTILDLAPLVDEARLAHMIEDTVRLELFDVRTFDQAIAAAPRRAGAPKVRAVLANYRGTPDLRSRNERIFRELVRKSGLPEPRFNVLVEGVLVDAFWPQWRLCVEIDSIAFHMTPSAFERDRVRDAILQKAGYRVLRISEKRLKTEPQAVIADVIALSRMAA